MPPLPLLRPDEVVRALQTLGWTAVRQRGSHIILTKPGEPVTLSVPNHDRVARGTLRSLLRNAKLDVATFLTAAGK